MCKYILKKEYPGSPKLGIIVDLEKSVNGQIVQGKWCYDIDKTPEFWELVIEKDYEILSLVASEKNPQHKKGSKFLHNKDYKFKNMHPTEFWDIYSVKRLSDSEIFTVGDKIQLDNDNKEFGTITELYISYEQLRFYCGRLGGVLCHDVDKRNNFTKLKRKLFKTEDGVDIFEGDIFYYVKFKQYNNTLGKPFEIVKGNHSTFEYEPQYEKYFSTKEKAEEYILLNKPVLSLKEIKETTTIKGLSLKKLEKLVQQKLK